MEDESLLNYDKLKNEALSIQDDSSISDKKINPVRAEYEELKKSPEFKQWRVKQYELQKGHCAYCYRTYPFSRMQVDHVWPICHGGKNNYANLVLACKHCNEDLKYVSAFNRISYFRAKRKIRNDYDLKRNGYVPIKIYWRRPKWIPQNPYSNETVLCDESIPESQRNVWDFENPIAPITIANSIKQEDVEDMSGFVAKKDTPDTKPATATSNKSYGLLDDILEFIMDHIIVIVAILAAILFLWYVASEGSWSFGGNKTSDQPSPSESSSVPHYKENLNCGCGASLLCDEGECHCVQNYVCEEESYEDIYGDY